MLYVSSPPFPPLSPRTTFASSHCYYRQTGLQITAQLSPKNSEIPEPGDVVSFTYLSFANDFVAEHVHSAKITRIRSSKTWDDALSTQEQSLHGKFILMSIDEY
jgi:hypothetical protein